ncbi:MAG: hypothetical protein WDZ40_00825 [Candidatus Spechtbacterales bacterium]
MVKFYHFTPKENVGEILEKGLHPGSKIGKRNTWLGVQGDPEYIYLFHYRQAEFLALAALIELNPEITSHSTALFEVSILDASKVERDYDSLLHVFLDERLSLKEQEEKIAGLADARFGLTIVDFSEKGICNAIDSLAEEQWIECAGTYRTKNNLDDVVLVRWQDLLSADKLKAVSDMDTNISQGEKIKKINELLT